MSRLNAGSKLTRTLNNLDKLANSLAKFQNMTKASESLVKISNAISKLSSVPKLSGLNSSLNTLKKFPEVVAGLDATRINALAKAVLPLSSALSGLTGIQKLSGLNSALNTLKKLPEVSKGLSEVDMDSFASQLTRVKNAVQPLANEMQKISSGFAALPANVQKVINANAKLAVSNKTVRSSFSGLTVSISSAMAKLTFFGIAINRVAEYLGKSLANYNAFVENVNLFTVSMGEFVPQAAEFTQSLQDVLGVDASEAMRNMGVIQNLVTSFGAAGDQAYVLSKNLTQLGYDFASFFNISTEESFTKLQAAISGELEPIRRLGVDISEARLQQELYNLGIQESVQNLSQADKAILRYIAIMDQTSNAQTDMARTLNSPANMIRVFQAQIELLSRSIGSLLIPMLNAVLPPLIAAVQIIREFISAIAAFFGIEVSFSNFESAGTAATGAVSSGLDNVADSASGAAKEMAYLIGGFDELNVLSSKSGSSGGAGTGGGSILGGVDLPEYDMFSGLAESKVAEWVDKLRGPLTTVLKIALAVGAALLAWKIGSAVLTGINLLKTALPFIKDAFLIMAGQFELLGTAGQKILTVLGPIASTLGISVGTLLSIMAAVVIIVARFVQLYTTSEQFRQGLSNTWEIIKSMGEGLWEGLAKGLAPVVDEVKALGDAVLNIVPEPVAQALQTFFGETLPNLISGLDLDVGDLIMTLGGIGLLFVPGGQILGVAMLAFEAISVAIRGMGLLTDEQIESIKTSVYNAFEWIGEHVDSLLTILGGIGLMFIPGGQIVGAIMAGVGAIKLIFDSLGISVQDIMSSIGNFVGSVFSSLVNSAKNAVNSIVDFFNRIISALNGALSFSFDGFSIGGKQVVPPFNVNLGILPTIPHLADGGVLTQSQVVLAGEYSGASKNPEIVTPQSIMRETVIDANGDMVIAIVAAIQALQRAVEEKDSDVVITEGDIGRAAVAYGTRQRRRTGKNPYSV